MNRRQLEVQKAATSEEAKLIRQLKEIYGQASKDCADKIRELSMRKDMENLRNIIWRRQYQEALKKQLDNILNMLNGNSFTTIADYLTECYENGFFGTLYDLQGQGVPLIFPINQKEAAQAIQIDSKLSEGYYKRLGEDTASLKKTVRTEISRGVSNGASWNQMAEWIANGMKGAFHKAYNNALRIARTEGHRVQQEAAYHCQQHAKSKGADVVKQWDSTLDGKTRPHHVALDRQVREIDEPFEVAGMKAMYPGAFGIAGEDIHCRCCLLQRARWVLSEEEYYDKWDGEKRELVRIEAKSYNEFKGKCLKNIQSINVYDEYNQNKEIIGKTLQKVENERRKLNYEVGTVLDRKGNVINVTEGKEHSVSPPVELLKDNIFTHNHPGGGCFSDTDVRSFVDLELLELRVSTPQGIYFSLMRKEGMISDLTFADKYKEASSLKTALDKIKEDLKAGKLLGTEEGYGLIVRYRSELGRKWLLEHADEYGYIFKQGVI